MVEHLGYNNYECSDNSSYRNGHKPKKVCSKYGEVTVDVLSGIKESISVAFPKTEYSSSGKKYFKICARQG